MAKEDKPKKEPKKPKYEPRHKAKTKLPRSERPEHPKDQHFSWKDFR